MSDTRQYFKKAYTDCSTNGSQTDATLISMRFYPQVASFVNGKVIYTCDFIVTVEFKDDGRLRLSTEDIYIAQTSQALGKIRFGGHDNMGTDIESIQRKYALLLAKPIIKSLRR